MPNQISPRTVDIGGFKMTYVEEGAGEPVVFVHGSITDHRTWDEHRKITGSRYRAIAIDLRYFGTDDWPDDGQSFSMQCHADDVAAFVRTLDIEPVTLVGWSYGGAVSLVVATQHREIVRRLFLHEPSLGTFVTQLEHVAVVAEDRGAMTQAGRLLVEAGDLAGAACELMKALNTDDGAFDRLPEAAKQMLFDNVRMLPPFFASPPPPAVTDEDLRGLDIPILISMGGETRSFFKTIATTAAKLLPAAELKIIDKAKHLWPAAEPAEFSRLLLDFLDRT